MSNFQYSTEIILAALRYRKGLVYLAAKDLGCHPDTIRMRAKQEPIILAELKRQRGELVDKAEEGLIALLDKQDAWAIGFTLKTLGRKRGYVERIEARVGGDAKAPPVQTSKTKDLTFSSLPLALRQQIAEYLRSCEEQHQHPENSSNGQVEKVG